MLASATDVWKVISFYVRGHDKLVSLYERYKKRACLASCGLEDRMKLLLLEANEPSKQWT